MTILILSSWALSDRGADRSLIVYILGARNVQNHYTNEDLRRDSISLEPIRSYTIRLGCSIHLQAKFCGVFEYYTIWQYNVPVMWCTCWMWIGLFTLQAKKARVSMSIGLVVWAKAKFHYLGRNYIENRGEAPGSTYTKRVQRNFSPSRYHLGGPSSPKSSLTLSVTSDGTGVTVS